MVAELGTRVVAMEPVPGMHQDTAAMEATVLNPMELVAAMVTATVEDMEVVTVAAMEVELVAAARCSAVAVEVGVDAEAAEDVAEVLHTKLCQLLILNMRGIKAVFIFLLLNR